MTEPNLHPDFFIFSIIDREFEAIKHVFRLGDAMPYKGRDYFEGNVSRPSGKSYSFVCTQSYDAGNLSAATATTAILNNFYPKYFLLVGIAGGVNGRKNIQIGDVVVSTDVKYYELEKQTKGKKIDKSGVNATPSQTLLNVYRRIKDTDWQSQILEARPDGDTGKSSALAGKILSGEKLLGDENSDLLQHLLSTHQTALAVEMEGAGVSRAIYEESTHNKAEFLDIRAISDYCNTSDNQGDRDKWRKHSSLVAATFARCLIENTNIDSGTQSHHEKYIELYNKNIPKKKNVEFNLEIKIQDEMQSADNLHQILKDSKKVILQGNAGGGKTGIVRKLSSYQIAEGTTPILIDLKMWNSDISKELMENKDKALNERLNIILKASLVPSTVEMAESFGHPLCIIVDGLNEISGTDYGDELQRVIVNTVADYVQQKIESTAIVVDRFTSREFLNNWKQVELQKLSDGVVKSIIDERFGENHYESLSKGTKEILSTAFFLNFVLKRDSAEISSMAEAIEQFFHEVIQLNNDELDQLAHIIFDAGMKHQQLALHIDDLENFEKKDKLIEGYVLKVRDGDVDFDHQLQQEYLFSRHLCKNNSLWNHICFDMMTLKSNSPESLFMTLEQIADQDRADEFILAVYDWNWKLAIRTVEWNSRINIKNFSEEVVVTMLAVVSLKQQDRVFGTSNSSKNLLAESVLTHAEELTNAKNISEIKDIILSVEAKYGWIDKCKELFSLDRESHLTEEQILNIISDTSIVGWTATNIIRESTLNEQNLLQLRTIFHSSNSTGHLHNTRRWRVVHALGKFSNKENVTVLFNALRKDPYHWVRYGAIRSLVEIAANSEELRENILEELSKDLETLHPNLLDEMAKTAYYRSAKGDWQEKFLPLLEKVKELDNDTSHTEKWENVIKEFRDGEWKD